MEELLQKIDELFASTHDVGKKSEEDFEIFAKTLDNIVQGKKDPSLTPQQKKKAKRLSVIVDDEDSETSTHELITSKINHVEIKTEMIETSMVRPSRAAKSKVSTFKEPSLLGKLRRPSNTNETLCEKDDSVDSAKKVKIDESILIVPNGDVPVLEISDGDVDKLMPPPVEIPKKKPTRKGKTSDSPVKERVRSSRLRIKQEKLSLEKVSVTEKIDETESSKSTEILDEIKEEKHNTTKHNKGGKKSKKPYKCMPMKEERLSDNTFVSAKDVPVAETNATFVSTNDAPQPPEANATFVSTNDAPQPPEANATFVSTNDAPQPPEANATFVSTSEDAPQPQTNATMVVSNCPQQTFIMEKENASDQTQVISVTKKTNSIDATFSVNNETFQAPAAEQQKQQPNEMNIMRSSIMTEEDSGDEFVEPAPLPQPLLKANQKKELFNPCIQSPVKKKVEAFEKHATAMASPAAQRQTRTKSKLKENRDPEPPGSKLVTPTPLLKRDLSKLLTPTLHANITPNNAIPSNLKKYANSTSKLSQMQKTTLTKSTSSLSKTPSLSRDNSAEDLKRAGGYSSKLQQIVDEKKKKREQKQQQAALAREAKEQERVDKVKKTMQEKEDKRRKVQQQQLEMKKQLEDMNRVLKMQEDEAQKKFEKKQSENELGEAARKERERLDNLRIQKAKDELQHKLLENQRMEQEKKAAKKAKENMKYDFDNLNSGDSTDEEGKSTAKRPPPPIWSKSSIRQMIIDRQSELDNKVVDSLFSVQPMTPDLREIFPKIDPRYLKRNSSMYWNTPPRYSQLPKY